MKSSARPVKSFLDSSDAGKDGAFAGTWEPTKSEALSGRFVIQCKFTSKQDKNLSTSDLKDEVKNAKKLVKKGRCDCYILMTNAATRDFGQIRDFFEAGDDTVWITFYGGQMWWCFARPVVKRHKDGKGTYRKTADGWKNTDIRSRRPGGKSNRSEDHPADAVADMAGF